MAYKSKMDLALGVALGSATQISLFVVPFMVLTGWAIGQPLDLFFGAYETVITFVATVVVGFAVVDGETNWLEVCARPLRASSGRGALCAPPLEGVPWRAPAALLVVGRPCLELCNRSAWPDAWCTCPQLLATTAGQGLGGAPYQTMRAPSELPLARRRCAAASPAPLSCGLLRMHGSCLWAECRARRVRRSCALWGDEPLPALCVTASGGREGLEAICAAAAVPYRTQLTILRPLARLSLSPVCLR
jgi:hypothetical protein